MKGLKLFSRTSSQDSWIIASYHSPHSLTWLWVFTVVVRKRGEGKQLAFNKWRDNNGLQWAVQLYRWVFQWSYQKPMWYRDMLQREWDKQHRERYESPNLPPQVIAEEHRTIQ